MKHVKNMEKWGKDTAKERYSQSGDALEGGKTHQAPQDPIDKHGAKYDNDATGWVRGMGKKSPYPEFKKGG